MTYDCFFSYQHEDLRIVESVVQKLEEKGILCWYAPRNVKGKYAKAISDGIRHSKVFVLILNSRSAISSSVLNEVEMAHNYSQKEDCAIIQPVCTEALDFNAYEFEEMMYYIRRRHFINVADGIDFSELADKIIESQSVLQVAAEKRTSSAYVVQAKEDDRLALQNELLDRFDNDVYANVLERYAMPAVLDVGCGTGDMLIPKLQNRKISVFIGLDKSVRQISGAKEKYTGNDYRFYENDVEGESFEADFVKILQENNIGKFDIINVSMLLLHLKNPVKLLTVLHEYLSDEGTLIIRDIDDGINFAFPDDSKAFDRIYSMCEHDEQSGNRRNGRQVYSYLVRAGFSRIRLECQGLSSAGMSDIQKEALFRMYFPFTLENAEIMMKKYPRNITYKEDYLWFRSCYDDIHKSFMNPDFVFSLGFMTYTAQK